jgi:hypothetical protein
MIRDAARVSQIRPDQREDLDQAGKENVGAGGR